MHLVQFSLIEWWPFRDTRPSKPAPNGTPKVSVSSLMSYMVLEKALKFLSLTIFIRNTSFMIISV